MRQVTSLWFDIWRSTCKDSDWAPPWQLNTSVDVVEAYSVEFEALKWAWSNNKNFVPGGRILAPC